MGSGVCAAVLDGWPGRHRTLIRVRVTRVDDYVRHSARPFPGPGWLHPIFWCSTWHLSCTVNRVPTLERVRADKFDLSRAAAVGGLAGIIGGWAFGQWMAKVNHFPLIAELIHLSSRNAGVALHFVFAFIIGASYGLLFQRDVRGYGSSLGWGLGYGILWWFLGPMA